MTLIEHPQIMDSLTHVLPRVPGNCRAKFLDHPLPNMVPSPKSLRGQNKGENVQNNQRSLTRKSCTNSTFYLGTFDTKWLWFPELLMWLIKHFQILSFIFNLNIMWPDDASWHCQLWRKWSYFGISKSLSSANNAVTGPFSRFISRTVDLTRGAWGHTW